MRAPIKEELPVEEVIALMAEGESEAVFVITEILTKNQQGPQILLDMDDMNIRGKQIVVGVRDICHGKIKLFCRLVYHRSPWLVNELNKEIHTNKAVESGASFSDDR